FSMVTSTRTRRRVAVRDQSFMAWVRLARATPVRCRTNKFQVHHPPTSRAASLASSETFEIVTQAGKLAIGSPQGVGDGGAGLAHLAGTARRPALGFSKLRAETSRRTLGGTAPAIPTHFSR